jgi:DNA-binding transcriptional MerR regulator
VGDRSYLSIGEVLSLLRDEFPDVTISKIRFLESQGLLDPERTPSGYRKFYAADVERLRWILRQQRENFLPLKVIKGRLAEPVAAEVTSGPPASVGTGDGESVARRRELTPPPETDGDALVTTLTTHAPPPAPPAPAPPAPAAAAATPLASSAAAPADTNGSDLLTAGTSSVNMTFEELCAAVELSAERVRELEKFGLVAGRSVAGGVYYDEEAFVVAKLAAGFHRFGVEARHLRIYKNAAEREAGFFEQVVMPLMKQRNPSARRQALDTLSELARLGQGLRGAMLRQALRDYTTP